MFMVPSCKHFGLIVAFSFIVPCLSVSRAVANGGDTCGTATVIASLPFSDTGTTNGFANNYDETCVNSSAARDVVYSYTPASTQKVTISLCPSAYDTFLYVYETNCPGTVAGCNDDACGTSGLRSKLSAVTLTGGKTYFIVVDGFSNKKGSFTIDVTSDFLTDHLAGQESNAFTSTTSTTNDELFAFELDPGSSPVMVTQVVFTLSNINGLTDTDWSGIELVVDSDNDGNIGSGETTTVGGAGVINTTAKTITFSTSFTVTTNTSYILRADFTTLSIGDSVTIDLLSSNISGGPGTGTASSAAHALIDLSSGLAGFWKLNDNTGTSATDSTGNGRTATLVNGPVWTGGIFSSALDFDEANDHLLVTDFSYGPDFTWTFWFKTEDNSGSFLQYMLSHGSFGVQNSVNVYLIEGTSILRTVILDTNDTLNTSSLDVSDTLVATGWHLYTLTVKAGVGSKVFVDGVQRASDAALGGDSFNPTTNIFLAARQDLDANRFYGGRIDDVRLYSRALDLAEIQQLAKGAGLKGHWKLDDGAGTTALDSAGLNDGTLTNGPTWTTGRLCGGLSLDGTNDYVQLAGSSTLISGDSSFSLSAWFQTTTLYTTSPTALGGRILTVYQSNLGSQVSKAAIGVFGDNTDTVMFMYENPGVTVITKTSSSLNDGQWHHLAGTYDAGTNTAMLYYDGAFAASADAGTIVSAGTEPARIGTGTVVNDGIFNGLVDDVRIYNRALSASEVKSLAATYQVEDLGSKNSTRSLGNLINASEQVVGFDSNLTTGNSTAWSSRFCLFTTIPPLPGGSINEAFGVNAAGAVVGWSDATGGIRKAFLWTSGGGTTDLGLISGRTDSEAFAVNSSNEVVGTVLNFGVPPEKRLAFFNLPVANYGLLAGMNNLGTLGGGQSVARDVNDSGQVVGGAQDSTPTMKPFIWLPTAAFGLSAGMNSLGTLGGESNEIIHRAQAINATGAVVGRSYTAAGQGHGFHWANGTMTDMGTLKLGDSSWAFDINDSGTAVGTGNVSGGAFHAFVWDGTTITDLNSLISSGTGWTLVRATGINNDGEITGWGTNDRNETHAFMLTQTCSVSTSAQSSAASLAQGIGDAGGGGKLEIEVADHEGHSLAEVLVADAEAGEVFSYEVKAATRSEDDLLANSPAAPGPGAGTFSGFADDQAFDRTLLVSSSASPGDFVLTVRMNFSDQELKMLGVTPFEIQLHVLDSSHGKWVPAGKDIGESPPSDNLGESGVEVFADGSADFWAVRDSTGIFAVGRPVGASEQEASLPSDEVADGQGIASEQERPPIDSTRSETKLVPDQGSSLDDELASNRPNLQSMPCGVGMVPFLWAVAAMLIVTRFVRRSRLSGT